MIRKDDSGFGYILICDHCEEEFDGFDTFDDAVSFKQENEWRSVKSRGGDWYELCPECAPENAKKYREMS